MNESSRATPADSPPLSPDPEVVTGTDSGVGELPETAAEAVARFRHDRARIVSELLAGRDPGPLAAVEQEAGDRHQGGRSVAVLRFADSTESVVYKPRSVQTADLYVALVAWLAERCPDLAPATVPTLVRDGYGWSRFVAAAPCRTLDEVRRFYRRQGAVLALLHATGATDMHAENVIACGDQPLYIDTETLLHPVIRRAMLVGADPAATAHEDSVQRTLLLPTLMRGPQAAFDISGLGGSVPNATNRPMLDGVAPDPADHLSDLLHGFGAAYDAISQEPDSFCQVMRDARDIVTRFVPRGTRQYAELLQAGKLDFDAVGFAGAERLLDHERRDLAAGDIPIFFTRPGSRSVWTSGGEEIGSVLPSSGLESATAKVHAMNAEERRRQEWMIEAAFASRAGAIEHQCFAVGSGGTAAGDPGTLDPQWALDQAISVAHHLTALAYQAGGRLNWLGLEPLEDGHWMVLPAGLGLSHGYGGIALFLAQLGAVSGRSEFMELAARSLAVAPALVAAWAERPGHLAAIGGGFDGMGGVAYALQRLSVLLDAKELARAADLASSLAARAASLEAADTPATENTENTEDTEDHADDSWCHGLAGRAATGTLGPTRLKAWLTRLESAPPHTDLTVCHGEFGLLESLSLLAPDNRQARAALRRRAARLPDAIARGAVFSSAPNAIPTPGFLLGLAGVGYGLLRLAYPETVPSVLTLRTSP